MVFTQEKVMVLMLQSDSMFKKEFELKKELEKDFAQNWYMHLDWVFKKSEHYESAHLQYLVYRVLK